MAEVFIKAWLAVAVAFIHRRYGIDNDDLDVGMEAVKRLLKGL